MDEPRLIDRLRTRTIRFRRSATEGAAPETRAALPPCTVRRSNSAGIGSASWRARTARSSPSDRADSMSRPASTLSRNHMAPRSPTAAWTATNSAAPGYRAGNGSGSRTH
jgi:hypothetical protein